MNTNTNKGQSVPEKQANATVVEPKASTPVTPATTEPTTPATAPAPATTPVVAPVEDTSVAIVPVKPCALAKVGGEMVEMPEAVAEVMKATGVNGSLTVMTAVDYLCRAHGIRKAKKQKLGELKELIGKDKAKLLIAEFNRKKVAYHIWSAKAALLAAGDSSMRKALRVVMGKGNVVIGFDTKARFVAQADSGLSAENAQLKERLAALELKIAQAALPAPAKA